MAYQTDLPHKHIKKITLQSTAELQKSEEAKEILLLLLYFHTFDTTEGRAGFWFCKYQQFDLTPVCLRVNVVAFTLELNSRHGGVLQNKPTPCALPVYFPLSMLTSSKHKHNPFNLHYRLKNKLADFTVVCVHPVHPEDGVTSLPHCYKSPQQNVICWWAENENILGQSLCGLLSGLHTEPNKFFNGVFVYSHFLKPQKKHLLWPALDLKAYTNISKFYDFPEYYFLI